MISDSRSTKRLGLPFIFAINNCSFVRICSNETAVLYVFLCRLADGRTNDERELWALKNQLTVMRDESKKESKPNDGKAAHICKVNGK
jgi:hypothetical protein